MTEAVALLLIGANALAVSVRPQAPVPPPLVLDGVTVIDVVQGKLLTNRQVVIVGNRIRAVNRLGAVPVPAGAQVISAQGKYVIPGLWDMHVHTDASRPYPLFLANGVTGFRDAWANVPLDSMLRWQREILAGTRVGPPRQLLSGVALDQGDGTCVREANGFIGHVCVAPDTADIGQLVQSLKAAGASFVKTYALQPKTYFMVVAAARRAGLRVGGHAATVSPIDAADHGVSILDHVGREQVGVLDSLCFDPMYATVEGCRSVAEHFRRANTWSTPTLSNRAIRMFADADRRVIPKLLVKAVTDFWSTLRYEPTWLDNYIPLPSSDTGHFASLKIPMQVGLPILSGGDTKNDAGFKTHADMAIMVDRGLTPLAALQAATLNPAKMLQATDSLGTVAAGKLADLVVLDANPLVAITNTTHIHAVVANGRYFDRAALDSLLTELRPKAQYMAAPP